MIDFISTNIGWVKDSFTTIFAITGTVLAILTYRRARYSILQPIRNEVIKKQSELLTNLLSMCQPGSKFDSSLDYLNLVRVNVYLQLKEFGYLFNEHEKIIELVSDTVVGWTPIGDSLVIKDVEVVGTFQNKKKNVNVESSYGKYKYDEAMAGNIIIDKIFLTKDHSLFLQGIQSLVDDPFMPKPIQTSLKALLSEVNDNLVTTLSSVLREFISEFLIKSKNETGYPKFESTGVYNDFNHARKHHREQIHKTMTEIRDYLKIDETWE
jgi:hypothetical protein